MCLCRVRGPGLAPAGDSLSFASPKESKPRKSDPTGCVPSLRCGQPAVLASSGVSLELASLRQSRALIRWPLRSSAHPEGNPQADIHTGHCCARPSLRSARRLRPGGVGRAQRWPEGMFGCGIPSGCAEERSGQRIRARDCLSAAGASSSETPLDASTAGCPQRSEGTQRVGSPFFWVLVLWRSKEKYRARRGETRPPP